MLCSALETYIKILQLNGKGGETSREFMTRKLKLCMKEGKLSRLPYRTLDQVLNEIAIKLWNIQAGGVEDRQIH